MAGRVIRIKAYVHINRPGQHPSSWQHKQHSLGAVNTTGKHGKH